MSSVYDFEDFYYEWYFSLYSWDWYEDQYHSSEKYKALLGYPLMSDKDILKGFKPVKRRKMNFEDYNDMVDALLVLFEEYISKDIDTSDVEWCVSRTGVELCQWMLDDLHITINVTNNKVVLHCPDELGRKYLKRKVELIWKTIQEIGDAD